MDLTKVSMTAPQDAPACIQWMKENLSGARFPLKGSAMKILDRIKKKLGTSKKQTLTQDNPK